MMIMMAMEQWPECHNNRHTQTKIQWSWFMNHQHMNSKLIRICSGAKFHIQIERKHTYFDTQFSVYGESKYVLRLRYSSGKYIQFTNSIWSIVVYFSDRKCFSSVSVFSIWFCSVFRLCYKKKKNQKDSAKHPNNITSKFTCLIYSNALCIFTIYDGNGNAYIVPFIRSWLVQVMSVLLMRNCFVFRVNSDSGKIHQFRLSLAKMYSSHGTQCDCASNILLVVAVECRHDRMLDYKTKLGCRTKNERIK